MFISSRAKAMIQYLKKTTDFVTISTIAQKLKVTERTVYREIPQVNQVLECCGVNMETVQGKGVRLQGDQESFNNLEELLKEKKTDFVLNPQERLDLTLIHLLNQEDTIKTQVLAIETRSSLQTTRNDLKQIEEFLTGQSLELRTKKGEGIYLAGSEVQKHHLLVNLLMKNIDVDYFFLWMEKQKEESQPFAQCIKQYGQETIFRSCFWMIKNKIEEKKLRITDTNFQEFVFLTALMVWRCQKGKRSYEGFSYQTKENDFCFLLKMELQNELEKQFTIHLQKEEQNYLYWLIGLSIGRGEKDAIQKQEIALAPKVHNFIDLVEERLGIYLRDDNALFQGLMSHMDKALNRIRSGMSVSNPIKREIQANYEQLYQIIQKSVNDVFPDDEFPDDEVGYLVLYFAVSLDKITKKSFRVLVVCSSGMGSSKMLANRLEREIPEIYIKKIVALINLPEESLEDYDLILSTVPLYLNSNYYMMVSPLLNDRELEKVKDAIRRHKHKNLKRISKSQKKQSALENSLDDLEKMHTLSGWAVELLKQFCVVSVDEKNGQDILAWMDRHLFDSQITTSSKALQDFVKERGKETCFVIPNTKLSYFECYLEEIKKPILMVYHFDHGERESFFSQDGIDILSVVLMLYPRKGSELLLEFLGEITMLIIEEADTILLFENGEEEKLFRLLGQRVKQYILDHV